MSNTNTPISKESAPGKLVTSSRYCAVAAKIPLLSSVLFVLLSFNQPASAGWLDRLFHTDSCAMGQFDSNSGNLSICAKSVVDFTEQTRMDYPVYLTPVHEPSTNMILTQITDNARAGENALPRLTHHYSKRQAWNLDETLIDLGGRILSAQSYQPVLNYEPLSSARNWSNVYPDKLIGIRYHPKANSIASFNVSTEQYEELARFEGYDKCSFGQAEGNLTNDDSKVLVSCTNVETDQIELIAYDLENRVILGTLIAEENFNWASFSQSGNYIVAENNTHPDPNPVLIRYSTTLENPVLLSTNPAHGDLALDADGNDLYVMIYSNTIQTVRLADRYITVLPIGGHSQGTIGSGHVSCRALDRPGWCYLSTYTERRLGAVQLAKDATPVSQDLFPLDQKLMAKATAYEHWGYHRSTINSYRAIAKASVSRSGQKILFTSDWYGEQEPNDFVLELSIGNSQ